MTAFPQSPFPRTVFDGQACTAYRADRAVKTIGIIALCTACGSAACAVPYYEWERRGKPHRDFPVLRPAPLWQQTWIFYDSKVDCGHWFPPLRCGPSAFGDPRKMFFGSTRRSAVRDRVLIYSTDNCADCTAALQAVELMVYSVARFLADEPEQWEHRCFYSKKTERPYCAQCSDPQTHNGQRLTLTDLFLWRIETEIAFKSWAIETLQTTTATVYANVVASLGGANLTALQPGDRVIIGDDREAIIVSTHIEGTPTAFTVQCAWFEP